MLGARCRGLVVVLLLAQTALAACALVLLPSLSLLLVPSASARCLFKKIAQSLQEAWLSFACVLLHLVLSIQLYMHVPKTVGGFKGLKEKLQKHDVILICNHPSTIDWMFIWGCSMVLGRLSGLKIVMKSSLKKVPGFGWAVQCFNFVFVSRSNKDSDLAELRQGATSSCSDPGPRLTYLIFPEGTDLSPSNLQKGQAFAKANGLKEYSEVLHPKTAGFVAVVEAAESASASQIRLLDATLGYVGHSPGQRPTEKDLFMGRPPKEVHIRLDMPSLADVKAKAETRLAKNADLCRTLFASKEARLARFSAPLAKGEFPELKALGEECEMVPLLMAPGCAPSMWTAVQLIVLMECSCIWILLYHRQLGIAAALGAPVVFAMATRFGGVDAWQRWHAQKFPAKSHEKTE